MSDPRENVRENYARRALQTAPETGARGTPCCSGDAPKPSVLDAKAGPSSSLAVGYTAEQLASLPEGADMGLGCGTPLHLADPQLGETVLDLGSGGGLDCFLALERVGAAGRVIGVDMTAEMIARARKAAADAGYPNVEFRLGEIENLPVADGAVDVIISNCVINLSPDKQRVYEECFRVLAPGGRVAFSDVVEIHEMSEEIRADAFLNSCCIGGARTPGAVEAMLTAAGFEEVVVAVKGESKAFIKDWAPGSSAEDYVASADISATKPRITRLGAPKPAATKACCAKTEAAPKKG
ncbi:MAG: arsenite methyltransferase [Myxococcales bacterium]|nr:arsenite methyltransferase [Myxococcales bacterium]